MNLEARDAGTGSVVVATVSAAWWEGFLASVSQVDSLFLMLGGAILLVLTIWAKAVELQIKRKQLKNMEHSHERP